MKNTGSQFIHERTPNLHSSREVEDVSAYLRRGGDIVPNDPDAKISAYLGFLANKQYVDDGILTGSESSVQRQVEAHVIDADEVPEAYFDLQRRIAREQGHGDVEVTTQDRSRLIEAMQSDQRAGLNNWIEYIGGDDGSYPDWFKYYAFEAVTKLGGFNKDNREFAKRSKGTTAVYPELNREALAYVYDAIASKLDGDQPDDDRLKALLQHANFGKLYAHAVLEVTPDSPELRHVTVGSWTKYDETRDPRTARRLASSLQGHGTGWCTAGKSTAEAQLSRGDFYVYYSRDEDNKDTVPRVAIRMEAGQVAEVRGINSDQNLEGNMADIAMEQLHDLPGGPEYQKKADDMKRLTDIEKQLQATQDAELGKDDIRFLYELDHMIQGFGYQRDPRVDTIRQQRGGRDLPELTALIPEVVRDQAETSYRAYRDVADVLRAPVISSEVFATVLASKEASWQADGVYGYLAGELIRGGGGPNLIVTPNVLADYDQISTLARQFGKDQPYATYEDTDLYKQYSAAELSGVIGDDPVRLSLIPSGYSSRLGRRSAGEQLQVLETMQSAKPALNLRIPSVLDAISYWYELRAKYGSLTGDGTFSKTCIRHIDLASKQLGGFARVPSSSVLDDGGPSLYFSSVGGGNETRVSVG